jgi:hypothetical protein
MDRGFFDDAVSAFCEREAERTERFRQRRYASEVALIETATDEVEILTGVRVPMNNWTLHRSSAFTLIDPERAVSLCYDARLGVYGGREYHEGTRNFMFERQVRSNADLGELLALPDDFIDACRYVKARYPSFLNREINVFERKLV